MMRKFTFPDKPLIATKGFLSGEENVENYILSVQLVGICVCKLQGVQDWKHIDQFIPGFWFAIVTDRSCHFTTLTLQALHCKLNTREAVFQGLLFGLSYHENCLLEVS